MTAIRIGALGCLLVVLAAQAKNRDLQITVYCQESHLVPFAVLARGQMTASQVFATIQVRLEWRQGVEPSGEKSGESIGVQFDGGLPETFHPGALAYATPYGNSGTRIHILLDRVLMMGGSPRLAGALLGHVMAHEISHVTQRHVVKAIRQANAVEAGQDFSAASGHDLSSYSQLSDFTINLLNNGLSRTDELAADQLGTALATEAGYDPAGLRRSVERLEAREKSDVLLARFNKTHPPAADRLRAIDQTIDSHHGTAQGQRLADRFKQNIIKK